MKPSLRFKVFNRDGFTCQYCGKHPPEVVLECDHVIPKSKGGQDTEDNLLTACFACNRGKSSTPIDSPIPTVIDRAALLAEKRKQLERYDKMLRKQKEDTANRSFELCDEFMYQLGERYRFDYWAWRPGEPERESIGKFLGRLPLSLVEDLLYGSISKTDSPINAWKYFCGCCWRHIRGEAW